MNRINIGTLSGSARIWDSKIFTEQNLISVKQVKLEQSFNMPGVAQRVPGGLGSQIS